MACILMRCMRWTPAAPAAQGVAHVPEDQHARAMVMDFPAWGIGRAGYDGCLPTRGRVGMQHGTTAVPRPP